MSRRVLTAPAGSNLMAVNLYGQVATIFGSYGTVGLGIANSLASHGMLLVLPYQRGGTQSADFRQSQLAAQDPWNYHPMRTDFHRPAQIREMMEPADFVVCAIGRSERPNSVLRWRDISWGYDAVHRLLPVDMAKMAYEQGKQGFVYISQIGADVDSESEVLRAKGRAEIEIREAFPGAIIIRPSDVFSLQGNQYTDCLRSIAARMVHKPIICYEEMLNRVSYPVFAADIGVAVAHALQDPACHGKTYELGGRQRVTYRELLRFIAGVTKAPADTTRLPYGVCKAWGTWMEMSHWNTYTPRDYFVRMGINSIPNEVGSTDVCGWEDIGIDPRNLILMEEIAGDSLYNWTVRRGTSQHNMGEQHDAQFIW
ncbi:NADH-ubiquinone oxidoreductase 40 kDa subunit [Diplonema papillatum]|nr:NADH-ubiquinone oxidoreductase 40 kDa subunit [Diplonema papillatum]